MELEIHKNFNKTYLIFLKTGDTILIDQKTKLKIYFK